jgi:hypothetical protein
LLPLSLTEIVQCKKELAKKKNNVHVLDSSKITNEKKSNTNNLKGCVLIASKRLLKLMLMVNHVMF